MSVEKTTPTSTTPPKGERQPDKPFNEHEVRTWYMDMLTGSKSFSAFVEQLNNTAFNHFLKSR